MKKTLLYVGSIIILILSAITFVFIPAMVQDVGRGSKLEFGKYNGKPIVLEQGSDFANAVSQYSEMYKNQGKQLDESAYFYIYNYAFNSTVTTMAYTGAVEAAGFSAGKKAVNRALLPYYSDANGKFSQKVYNSVSEADRSTLRKDVSRNILFRRYYEDLFGSSDTVGGAQLFGLKSATAEVPFLREMGANERSFDMASFDTTTYPDDQVKAYAEKNPALFTKYALSVVTVKDEAKAKDYLKQIKNSQLTFADAVTNYSEKYYTGSDGKVSGNYQYQIKGIIPDEKNQASVLALAKDAYSDVIKTSNGYSIFRGDGASTPADFSDAAAIDVVRKYITANQSGVIEDYFTNIAKDFSAKALTDGFDKACKQFNVEKTAVSSFPLNYGNASIFGKVPGDTVKELADADRNENFLKTAFSLKDGEISAPVVVGKNVLVLKLTESKTNDVTDEEGAKTVSSDLSEYDQSSAQTVLFNDNKKVVNNVSDVYFNKILAVNDKNKDSSGTEKK